MKTYFFGDIEFGDFVKSSGDYYPVVLIHKIKDIHNFETDQEADDYCMDQNYAAYVDAKTKMEIYFRGE